MRQREFPAEPARCSVGSRWTQGLRRHVRIDAAKRRPRRGVFAAACRSTRHRKTGSPQPTFALTDPQQLAQWWGRGNKLVIERLEVERGGHWRFVEHAGGQTHGFEGRFREVSPPHTLVQTFDWDGMPGHIAINATTLEDLGDGRTKLVTVSLFHTSAERDGMMTSGMEGGVNQSYAALDKVLAAH